MHDIDRVMRESKPVFLPIDTRVSPNAFLALTLELENLPQSLWFFDEYRKVEMTCIFSGGGEFRDKESIYSRRKEKLAWTEASLSLPKLKNFISTKIFPLIADLGRVTILKTLPNNGLEKHIDCSKAEKDLYHPKLRLVLSGNLSGFYFLSEKGSHHITDKFPCYIIDGSRAHGMFNNSSQVKYTICLGTPWSGQLSDLGKKLIQESLNKNIEYIFYREDLGKVQEEIKHQN